MTPKRLKEIAQKLYDLKRKYPNIWDIVDRMHTKGEYDEEFCIFCGCELHYRETGHWGDEIVYCPSCEKEDDDLAIITLSNHKIS